MKFSTFAIASLMFVTSQHSQGQSNSNCATVIKSVQDAAYDADWVVEGDVVNTVKMNTSPSHYEVSIENAKVVFEREKFRVPSTALLLADSCFPNIQKTLLGQGASELVGKRMRFFGTKLTSGRESTFYFMQSADQAMPLMETDRKKYLDNKFPPIAVTSTSDSWLRARSTEGHFSIDMPGSFEDITKGSGGQPAFMLRGKDQYGSIFIAVFERSGPGSGMGGTFDTAMSEVNAKKSTFKGAEAVSTIGELPGSNGEKITHGLWFRIPGGTFMLGIVTNKGQTESLKSKERFFNSLSFE